MSAAPSKKPARKPYDRPPNGKGKERADEDAGKVRRPQNSWILYRKDKFELLRKEAETENKPRPIAAEASKIISEAWKNESPEVKKYYNDLAEKEKARHAEEHPDYKFKPKTKAQKLQERESRELAKKRKGDDLRSEREAKLAARSTRGVGSDKMQPPIPSGYPMFYPPFPMGPPPLPGQQPSTHPSAVPWFPFPYPAYLPTPVVYPAGHKTPNPPTTAAEATASESGSGSGHLTPGEAKVTKKRHSTEPNSTTSPQSASSAEASAPADSRATTAFSPPTVTPPTVQQEVGAPKSIPVRSSSTTSSHSAPEVAHPLQLSRPSTGSKPRSRAFSQPAAPAPTSPLSFDLNLLGMPLAGPSTQSSSSSGQSSSPVRPTSDAPNPFVDPKALSLAPSSSIPVFGPAPLQTPPLVLGHEPTPTHLQLEAGPVLGSLFNPQDIFSSYPCDTLDLPFPTSQEALELTGLAEYNFAPGTGASEIDEMFDWAKTLQDDDVRKWGGDWDLFNTGAGVLDSGSGEFELGEGLGGDDGRALDGAGIGLAVGPGVGVDTAIHAAACGGVPAVLPTPSKLITAQSPIAGSSSGSSGSVDLSGAGFSSDGLPVPGQSTFPTSQYDQQLLVLQPNPEAQPLWETDSPLSLSDYVDYTMCRTPSAAGFSRRASRGPSRPLSRAASASASGTGRGRSLSRSSDAPGTTPSRGWSVGSTRGRSLTKSVGGGSSRTTSRISRAGSHESVGRRMKDVSTHSFPTIPTGPTTSRSSSGGLGFGLDLGEMQVDPLPTLPPPSSITSVGPISGPDIGMSAVPSMAHQIVPSRMFRSVELSGGMDAEALAVFGGMLHGPPATQPTHVQPGPLDFTEPPTAPRIPPSMPRPVHFQSRSPIPKFESEVLASLVGEKAIAWDPSEPTPQGWVLVAVPVPNPINPATPSSLIPGTALPATRTIHSTSLTSSSGTVPQNGATPGMILPTSGIETWNINQHY